MIKCHSNEIFNSELLGNLYNCAGYSKKFEIGDLVEGMTGTAINVDNCITVEITKSPIHTETVIYDLKENIVQYSHPTKDDARDDIAILVNGTSDELRTKYVMRNEMTHLQSRIDMLIDDLTYEDEDEDTLVLVESIHIATTSLSNLAKAYSQV